MDIGVDQKNNGVVESETIWKVRMLNDASYHFGATYWEDDGGWSSRDGGNTYSREALVSSQPAGRTNYAFTSWADWDAYLYIVAEG